MEHACCHSRFCVVILLDWLQSGGYFVYTGNDERSGSTMKLQQYLHDLFTYAKLLLGIDSPTGYTAKVIDAIGQVAQSLDFGFEIGRAHV